MPAEKGQAGYPHTPAWPPPNKGSEPSARLSPAALCTFGHNMAIRLLLIG